MAEEPILKKIELTQVNAVQYSAIMYYDDGSIAKGVIDIEEESNWINVARSIQYEYNCDVEVNTGGDPPKVCFYNGDKPWRPNEA
jgi:hypothetical protein